MKKILLLGAGHSSSTLINYLLSLQEKKGWVLSIGDRDKHLAEEKGKGLARSFAFDIANEELLNKEVKAVDLVISMLPASYHLTVAKSCLQLSKHLVTASYVSKEMSALSGEAKRKNLIFLNECGLDPGIDHMSLMQIIDKIRGEGNELIGVESFTGGLLATTNNDNPWNYKFTWNPRNVVIAGQGVVRFIQEGRYKYIPYNKLFRRTEIIHIPKYGEFEGYANRDSLQYVDLYKLRGVKTLYRGTLRKPGFCKAWDVFVQLGATDDSYKMEAVDKMTHLQFINSFLYFNSSDSVELKLAHYLNLDIDGDIMQKLRWINIFKEELVGIKEGTPAQILEAILKKKWTFTEHDRDMIAMKHKFNYIDKQNNNRETEIHSTIVTIGESLTQTAMSKSVGLPLGIATKLILENRIQSKGVLIPIIKELYEPILKELHDDFKFDFSESCVLTP